MKRIVAVLFLLLACALPSFATSSYDTWVSGEFIYARVSVEKDYGMGTIVHKQKATVTISGPTGTQTYTTGFVFDRAEATVVVPFKEGIFQISGEALVFCTQGNRIFSTTNYGGPERYGVSGICVQKSLSTCTVNPATKIVSCWYYPICSWPRCSADFSVYIYGANNQRYLVKKKWRERAGSLQCFPAINIVADSCMTCTESYE